MSAVLARILASKEREIAAMDREDVAVRVRASQRTPIDVRAALTTVELALIAEIKLRSPSAGPLSQRLVPEERARRYLTAGASMVSVLCDGPFFGGSWEHVREVRSALDAASSGTTRRCPVLAKEFVLDEVQVSEARASGADAVLLIARIAEGDTLKGLVRAARDHGLEPVIEVVTERELERALALDAQIIGVNARDLDTLTMDAERAERVLSNIPSDRVAVYLSGLKSPEDVRRVATSRADAALIGEALMREDDPTELLSAMKRAAEASG